MGFLSVVSMAFFTLSLIENREIKEIVCTGLLLFLGLCGLLIATIAKKWMENTNNN